MLCFHEYTKIGWSRFRWMCAFSALMQVIVLLITRGHFFIDLVSGAIFADWLYGKVDRFLSKYYPSSPTKTDNRDGRDIPTEIT